MSLTFDLLYVIDILSEYYLVSFSSQLRELVASILIRDHNKRPTAAKILEKPILAAKVHMTKISSYERMIEATVFILN